MKSLALRNGDLVVGNSGHETFTGSARIRQDLALALGERAGTDRFHPNEWGSVVVDFIGRPIDLDMEFQVRSEVSRVLSQYIAIQEREIYKDFLRGTRSRFATADVVRAVTSIDARVDFDAIRIHIRLTTQSGESVDLDRTVVL